MAELQPVCININKQLLPEKRCGEIPVDDVVIWGLHPSAFFGLGTFPGVEHMGLTRQPGDQHIDVDLSVVIDTATANIVRHVFSLMGIKIPANGIARIPSYMLSYDHDQNAL